MVRGSTEPDPVQDSAYAPRLGRWLHDAPLAGDRPVGSTVYQVEFGDSEAIEIREAWLEAAKE